MRESRMYLRFFRKWLWVIGVFGILGLLGGYYMVNGMPELWLVRSEYEFSYTQETSDAVSKQADEAVSLLRSQELQNSLGIQTNETTIYKNGPFVLKIETSARDANRSAVMNSVISNYLLKNYSVHQIGQLVTQKEEKPVIRYLLFFAGLGIGLGLIISLIISYFKNF